MSMKIAIRTILPSPESRFIASLFEKYSVDVLNPWNMGFNAHYDVAFSIGPMDKLASSSFNILMVYGDSSVYNMDGYDMIVVTNDKALKNCRERFGDKRYLVIDPPVLDLNAGKRRISEKKNFYINYSINTDLYFRVKGLNKIYRSWAGVDFLLFNANDFNTYVRNGAVGYYDGEYDDGYNIQVKRHLSLGGRVVVNNPDEEVLGDLIKYVNSNADASEGVPEELRKAGVEMDFGGEEEYGRKIKELLCYL
jgi:hypothetical protein